MTLKAGAAESSSMILIIAARQRMNAALNGYELEFCTDVVGEPLLEVDLFFAGDFVTTSRSQRTFVG